MHRLPAKYQAKQVDWSESFCRSATSPLAVTEVKVKSPGHCFHQNCSPAGFRAIALRAAAAPEAGRPQVVSQPAHPCRSHRVEAGDCGPSRGPCRSTQGVRSWGSAIGLTYPPLHRVQGCEHRPARWTSCRSWSWLQHYPTRRSKHAAMPTAWHVGTPSLLSRAGNPDAVILNPPLHRGGVIARRPPRKGRVARSVPVPEFVLD